MIRFWVGFGKQSGQSCPNSNDVKSLFEVYGTVEHCDVMKYQDGTTVFAIVGMRDCKIPTKDIAAQMDSVVCKGVPARVRLVKKSEMCPDLANKGHCPRGFACKFAHSKSELKNEAKEAAAGDRHEMIQKPATNAGAFKQQTLQWEIEDLKEEIANLKQEVLKELKNEVKETAARDCHEMIQKPATEAGAFKQQTLQREIKDLKEEVANLKQEALKEKQRSNDLAVSKDSAWKLVGEMSLQIVQLTKELLKVQTGAIDAKESIPGPIDSVGLHGSAAPAEPTQMV